MHRDPDALSAALEDVAQSAIRQQLRDARREGRAAGPDLYAGPDSTYDVLPGVPGTQLYARRNHHAKLREFAPDEYGG